MMYVELIRQTLHSPAVSLSSARLFDHLTPKMQNLYSEAKKFKASHGYEYCWAKNWCVYLRKDGDSRALKIPRRRRKQERHKFTYLTVKDNSFCTLCTCIFSLLDISLTFSFFT